MRPLAFRATGVRAQIADAKALRGISHLNGDGQLLLADLVVFLLLVRGPQPLPRQATPQEVQEHIAERLEVVPPTLHAR